MHPQDCRYKLVPLDEDEETKGECIIYISILQGCVTGILDENQDKHKVFVTFMHNEGG